MRLYKFAGKWCSGCQAFEKSKSLEKFMREYPDVEVVDVDLPEPPEGDTEAKSPQEELADTFEVDAIPCFVFVDDSDQSAEEGEEEVLYQDSGGTYATLERAYKMALKAEKRLARD